VTELIRDELLAVRNIGVDYATVGAGTLAARIRSRIAPEVVETMTTFKRADGELIAGDYGWVAEADGIADDETPVEVVEQRWTLAATRTFWILPELVGTCEIEDQEPCEDDAVAYCRTVDGVWLATCAVHKWQDDGQAFLPIDGPSPTATPAEEECATCHGQGGWYDASRQWATCHRCAGTGAVPSAPATIEGAT
jgi:hypothetical protein